MIREAGVFILIFAALAPASCENLHPIHSRTPGYHQREARIKEELARLGTHAWAGKYASPRRLTRDTVYLSPSAGWAHYRSMCTEDSCNHGRILIAGERLIFADASGKELTKDELEREILGPLQLAADLYRIREEIDARAGERADRIEQVLQLIRERSGN